MTAGHLRVRSRRGGETDDKGSKARGEPVQEEGAGAVEMAGEAGHESRAGRPGNRRGGDGAAECEAFYAERLPKHSTDETDKNRFDQELLQYIALARAD